MPTIVAREAGYMARVRKKGFEPVARTFIKKADAVAWGRRVEADMQAGRWRGDKAEDIPTLAKAIETYRAVVAVTLKGERDYRYAFADMQALPMARKRVDRVEPADLAAWRDSMAGRGLKPATVARQLGMLSAVLTWCQKERRWIDDNPLRQVRKPVVRDGRTRTLSADEVRYLNIATAGARARWLADAVTLLCTTAMRRSELTGLQVADVVLARSVAVLRDSKNGDAREVPLCPEAKAAMQRLIDDAATARCASLLPINDPEAVSFAFRRAVVRAQARYEEDCAAEGREPAAGFLDGVRLHDLRHHAISTWARTGALSLIELCKVSGHRSVRSLQHYSHLSSQDVAEKLARISAPDTAQAA